MSSTHDPLDQLVEEFLARVRAGEELTVEAFAAEHPDHADLGEGQVVLVVDDHSLEHADATSDER